MYIVRSVRNLQNVHLLIVGVNEFTLDGYYKSSCFSEDRAWLSMLFYRHPVFEVQASLRRRVLLFHVVILSCVVLMFYFCCGRGSYKLRNA